MEQAATLSTAIANVGEVVAVIGGMSNPAKLGLNPFRERLYEQQAKQQIEPDVARCLVSLMQEGKVPGWVMRKLDQLGGTRKVYAAAR